MKFFFKIKILLFISSIFIINKNIISQTSKELYLPIDTIKFYVNEFMDENALCNTLAGAFLCKIQNSDTVALIIYSSSNETLPDYPPDFYYVEKEKYYGTYLYQFPIIPQKYNETYLKSMVIDLYPYCDHTGIIVFDDFFPVYEYIFVSGKYIKKITNFDNNNLDNIFGYLIDKLRKSYKNKFIQYNLDTLKNNN